MAVQKYDIRRPAAEGGGFEERYWSPVNSPVFGAKGEVASIIHRVEDVTEFIRLKQQGTEQAKLTRELRLRSEQMETEIFLRAQEIQEVNRKLRHANDELRLAHEQLKEQDRLKDEFLAMLAHELRNPLAPIRNATQILRLSGMDDGSRQRASDMLDRQVGHMVRLVDDLLDVSRITRGRIGVYKQKIELSSVVNDAVEAVRPLCESKNHKLAISLPAERICLNADPARLAQVLSNLLNNACKFTPQGGRIRLTVDHDDKHVFIRVRDNGIGIPEDQLPRIFELFAQVDASLERPQTGLGIGLTLVKSLVELHEGGVEARSDGVGKGSEFVVRLPVVTAPSGPQPQEVSVLQQPAASRRILLVDDNHDLTDSLAKVLELIGHEVHVAADGLEGVAAAERIQPDVILLDIGLPKLNGYETARRIREQQKDNRPVLVAITGWGQEADRQRSEEAGFNAHIVKPMDLGALTRLLAELSGKP